MDLSSSVLGSTVAAKLKERGGATVLRIGRDTFTRGDLAAVACFNFTAAANLSTILNRELQVRDTKAVYDTVAYTDLALPRLGAVSLAVLGAAFEAKGLGGDAPLENWVRRTLVEGKHITTFGSVKQQAERTRPVPRRAARRAGRSRFISASSR